jgi:phosphatidylinositol phospholipase C delta
MPPTSIVRSSKKKGTSINSTGMAAPKTRVSSKQHRIHFLHALGFIKIPRQLYEGVRVLIVAASGKTQSAQLRLSADKFTLWIRTTKNAKSYFAKTVTEDRAIDVGEIDRIQRGQSTQQFEKAKKKQIHGTPTTPVAQPKLHRNMSSGSNSVTSSSAGGASYSTAMIQHFDPELSFSIVFRGAHTLDLMAMEVDECDELTTTLDRILEAYQRAKTRVANDVLLLRYVWLDVDKDKTGYMNVSTIGKVFGQINFEMKTKDLHANYEKFGKILGLDRSGRRRGLTFEQSAGYLHYIRRNTWMVKPVNVIWNEIFGEVMNNGKKRETVSDKTFLEHFMRGKQGQMKTTILDVRKLFRKMHDMEISHDSSAEKMDLNRITKDQFEAFLFASENDAFDPEKEEFDMSDMTQPLSEYWINSSHNTYLVGDQYTSQSSVEMYSNALYRGCRCLELDIWDGSKTLNGTPIPVVWHGHTMTTKILFVEIIKTIKVFLNFHPDTFPLILSFENHCSLAYQEVMAEQLIRVLGASLYIPTEASLHGELPSPKQLRGMVIIKGRRPNGTEADAYDTDDDASVDYGATSLIGGLVLDGLEENANLEKHGVSPNLARLTLFHGNKHKTWEESLWSPRYHMHSFSENKVRSKCRHKEAQTWIMYNQSHMSRTYPAGARVDSSNYNPLLAWSTGCQLVALNFQTQDAFLKLNDGRFRENGNCGYVLKPSSLMVNDGYSPNRAAVRISIRVLSGSCLPKPIGQRSGDCIDPYVKVSVFDIKNDEKESIISYPTSIAHANGFFPIWSQEKFSFTIENWAVAMLQLTVYDKTKDEFIASSSIPVSCLRRGIRSVKLYDATNTRSGAFAFASLLLDLKMGHVVAEI